VAKGHVCQGCQLCPHSPAVAVRYFSLSRGSLSAKRASVLTAACVTRLQFGQRACSVNLLLPPPAQTTNNDAVSLAKRTPVNRSAEFQHECPVGSRRGKYRSEDPDSGGASSRHHASHTDCRNQHRGEMPLSQFGRWRHWLPFEALR
jgi:hypothetical protein